MDRSKRARAVRRLDRIATALAWLACGVCLLAALARAWRGDIYGSICLLLLAAIAAGTAVWHPSTMNINGKSDDS